LVDLPQQGHRHRRHLARSIDKLADALMPTASLIIEHLDQLYAYLKGRADGAIKKAKVEPIR